MKAGNFSVRRLMEDVLAGRIVLPDFQRSFVWKPDDVKDLLVSILGKYYIGSMLYMDEPRADAPFALRFIEGVEKIRPNASIDTIIKILLDGQQRTSSIFYALYAPALPLAGRKSPFSFFLKIPSLLSEEWEATVEFCLATNKKAVTKYSQSEDFIQFTDFHDIGRLLERLQNTSHKADAAKIITAVNDFMNYDVQSIELPRGTSLDRVVETFERINRTGEPLAVSDLLVARLYIEKIKLRQLIEDASSSIMALKYVETDYLLRIICLLRGKEVRRTDILHLDPKEFEKDWVDACWSLDAAYNRMSDTKNGYGAFDFARFAPFKTSLVPLAASLAYLKREKIETDKNFSKLDQWYWATAFANRYNEAVNTNTFADYRAMREWFAKDEAVPSFISDFNPYSVDLAVDAKNSAVYRAVMCVVVRHGALDYKTGQPPQFSPDKVQDDHIFPKSKYFDDTVLNRTLVSSNQTKASQDPGVFSSAVESINGKSET